jgi:uridine nucleosidase
VAIVEAPPEESDDGDIYADIGDDYDPLAELGEDTSGESGDDDRPEADNAKEAPAKSSLDNGTGSQDQAQKAQTTAPRNYFNDDPSTLSVLDKVSNPLHDPAILAALAKKHKVKEEETDDAAKKEAERRVALMRARDRDLEDMDMGFGGSRFEDEEEMAMDGSKVKLSEWNDGKGAAYDDDDGGKGEKKKRKRKRKGDKNSVADIMRVIESRK